MPTKTCRRSKYNADPVKLYARNKLAWFVRSGKMLRQPCEKCGEPKSQAHHHDYSNPLDVKWLCSPCHGIEHRKTHCIRGHLLDGENVCVDPRGNARSCFTCKRERDKKRMVNVRAKMRAERLAGIIGSYASLYLLITHL